jgi:tRNA(fMet)-specific endonuclease VapC
MYLIDTNICVYLIKNRDTELRRRIEERNPYEIAVSSVTVAELEYGVAKSVRVVQNRTALQSFLSAFEIVPFDDKDAEQFGMIRVELEREGRPIGPYDLQIAAQARARKWTVVTNNEREFRRVRDLSVENWASKNA